MQVHVAAGGLLPAVGRRPAQAGRLPAGAIEDGLTAVETMAVREATDEDLPAV
jgi:hypothetical protein